MMFEGKNASDAYRKAMGGEKRPGDGTMGSRWLKRVEIAARIAELNAKTETRRIVTNRVMTKTEEMEWLTQVVTTAPSEIDETSQLCQGYEVDANGKKKYKLVDKARALDLLAKMKAEFPPMEQAAAPVNVSVNVTVMSEDRRAELMTKKRQAIEKRRAVSTNN